MNFCHFVSAVTLSGVAVFFSLFFLILFGSLNYLLYLCSVIINHF